MIELNDRQKLQFFSKVEKTDECWLWTGKKNRGGYGEFELKLDGKRCQYRAHRVSYSIHFEDPCFLHVLHTCDNRCCVNPKHLFLGTNRDNVVDRHAKGRTSCRITWDTVREMRTDYFSGMTTREVDKKYGYVGSHAILYNRVWYDPEYTPPKRTKGPQPTLIEAYGESKTASEWEQDHRCQVTVDTIRKRYKEGIRGVMLLMKLTKRGRPRE